jgi:3-oxoacyl-[acyl-carrier-protein] synthase III
MDAMFDCVAIESIATVVPNSFQTMDSNFLGINDDEIAKITNITGITQVAIAPSLVTSLDLCNVAAKSLLAQTPSYLNEINVVIFVSQTRDYILPTSASLAQAQLGLKESSLCLDVPSGCTGYLHGLFLASTFLQSKAANKVLLLCGETNSKLINKADKSVAMIFGDAGSATVLGRCSDVNSYFAFKTDGTGYDKIIVSEGGARHPFDADSLFASEYENGNFRRPLDMKMDGMSVFNFAITSVPKLVSDTLSKLSLSAESIDLFASHQANKLIVNQLSKKCGFSPQKAPFLASKFGNTGPVSIPLLLTEGFANNTSELSKVMMCGFGVGLNWGVCVTDLSKSTVQSTIFWS